MTQSQPSSNPSAQPAAPSPPVWKQAVFVLLLLACAGPWASPPIALVVGVAIALVGWSCFGTQAKKWSRILIQIGVVALGLRIDLNTLAGEAKSGFVFAACTIIGTFVFGALLAKLLRVGREITLLISSGTAICGGSAIAAVGTAIGSSASTLAVATGSIFLLNAGALYAFPAIGHAIGMTDSQFGTWAGVAIHDVASVVGAAAKYHGPGSDLTKSVALDTANVVKLSRVLWILPIGLLAAWWAKKRPFQEGAATGTGNNVTVPWFVLLFLVASAARTFVPFLAEYQSQIKVVATCGFQIALFLIGSGLSKAALKKVGWRALTLAVLLWIAIAGGSLLVILKTVA